MGNIYILYLLILFYWSEWEIFSLYTISLFLSLPWGTHAHASFYFFIEKETQTEMGRSTSKNFSMGYLIW